MLDLPRYDRIRLSAKPLFQRFIALSILTPNYYLPPRVRIEFEGFGNVPDHPVIFAMNHTDRYNYWPLQYKLWRVAGRYTATWVKGKYYEHPLMGKFMEWVNSIPAVSRGYLITKDFLAVTGGRPTDEQYSALRGWVDAAAKSDATLEPPADVDLPNELLNRSRDVFGRPFGPRRESYADYINAVFGIMMARFDDLNGDAFEKGLDVIIFPQGTRSIRLSRGHIGLAEIALKHEKTIVPVGCNGSDSVYPGGSPIAKAGHIVYRFGRPISYADMAEFHIEDRFEPFTEPAETIYQERFRGLTDLVMGRINELLDPRYQVAEDGESDGTKGSKRFV